MLKVCYVLQMHMVRTAGCKLPMLPLLQWLEEDFLEARSLEMLA
jgi:hypothetical protein